MKSIDVNSDLGEGFGPYSITDDAALMPLVTSANIATGGHAGDPVTMARTLKLAQASGVTVGGHIGYPDIAGFGRRAFKMSLPELELMVISQLGALGAVAAHCGAKLDHANFHGALGNLSFADKDVARTIIGAIKAYDPTLKFIGLPDTEASYEAERQGLTVVWSFLADRGYTAPGRLATRGTPGAVIHEPAAVRERVAEVLTTGRVTTVTGERMEIPVDSILVHSDTAGALELAHAIRGGIEDAGMKIATYEK
ncbi:5-oxoprolinase subunit PxpA [Breoghania sp.]|uniref:LamB/YcsF family protein n=1 Tax=Breoghania sp. TaxID=2065378 RepID=UPI002AA84EEC|nr:5-oxoprolinase subunit PxpA [Breoghania sp.]